jgi:hypothetical protein
MPLPKGTRYRWKKTKSGKKIRLAFLDNEVIEVKKKGGKAKKVGRCKKKSKKKFCKKYKRKS